VVQRKVMGWLSSRVTDMDQVTITEVPRLKTVHSLVQYVQLNNANLPG